MTDNTNIQALLPCPFCESDDVHMQEPEQIEATSWIGYITCQACDVQVSGQYGSDSIVGAKISAAAIWNRRDALSNTEPAKDDRVEYEIWQGDSLVAGVLGPRFTATAELNNYAAMYRNDGPIKVYSVVRKEIDLDGAPA